jgi:hypothetical protein
MKSDFNASDFLTPGLFGTGHDVCEARAQQRYLDGRAECRDYSEIFICLNDTVCATLKRGGDCYGYEKLGYHAYTADYLRAILDSGCPVWVSRVDDDDKIVRTQIK